MPVDIQENINNLGDKILKNDKIRGLLINPLAYTIALTVVIIFIVFLFSSSEGVSYIYVGIFTFIIILVSFMFSHQALRNDIARTNGDEQYQDLIAGVNGRHEESDDHVEMVPRIDNIQF